MYCNKCGAAVAAGAVFCSVCGQAIGARPIAGAPAARVASNRTTLALLWIAYSVYHLGAALLLIGLDRFFGSWSRYFNYDNPLHLPAFVAPLLGAIGVFYLLVSFAGVAVGVGLLQLAPWGRVWAIALGILILLRPLFGTALGVYTLWVLLPASSDSEYNRLVGTQIQARGAAG